VALDSPLILRAEAAAALHAFACATPRDEFRKVARDMSEAAMSPDMDPSVRTLISKGRDAIDVTTFISLSRHVFANCFEELIADCDVQALCVTAVMANDVPRLAALCPRLCFGPVVGPGHFLQLDVPAQVNAKLDQFPEVTASVDLEGMAVPQLLNEVNVYRL
jgi:hypothetical protein